MKDQQADQKYKRYVGGHWTWLPIIGGLAMSINAVTVDFSSKVAFWDNLLGPVIGRSVYLLSGLSLIALGLIHALGFSRENRRILTADITFSERMKKHRN